MITTIAALALSTTQTAALVQRRGDVPNLRGIAVCPGAGSTFFVASEDNVVWHVDAVTRKRVRSFTGHPQAVYGLTTNAAGTILATGDDSGRIWLWDVKTGKKMREFPRNATTHQRGIQALSFAADGKTLASTGKDDQVIVWDVASAKPIKNLVSGGANVSSAVVTPGGMWAVTLGSGLWYYKANALTAKIPAHGSQGAMDFRADLKGTRGISGGRDGSVMIWNLTTRKSMSSRLAHEDSVISVAMAPNGRIAASSCSVDRTVKIWDVSTGVMVSKFDDQSAVGAPLCFTMDGKFFVSANAADAPLVYSVTPPVGVAPVKAPVKKKRR
ncbi:MAG: hypothetical protein JNJ45_07405 [Chthonomonas sp.]|nr:hypothetical protein [Chthonomonas sp.]